MNNSTNSLGYCNDLPLEESLVIHRSKDRLIIILFACEFFFAFGLVGNFVSLLAFYRCAKTEHAYVYQLLMMLSDILSIFFHWTQHRAYQAGITYTSRPIYKSYLLIKFAGSMVYGLSDGIALGTVIVLSATCVDRFYSLKKPTEHKVMKHKKLRAWGIFFISHFMGIGFSFHRAIAYDTLPVGELCRTQKLGLSTVCCR